MRDALMAIYTRLVPFDEMAFVCFSSSGTLTREIHRVF